MPSTLGCATEYAVIALEEIFNMNTLTGQASFGRPVGDLNEFSSLTWDRRLDDTSEATITIPTNADCCTQGFIAELHVWHHGIAIFRNGEQVWDGPIVLITASRTEVTIVARDVSALLSKRLLPRDLCFSNDPAVCTGGIVPTPPRAIDLLYPPVGQLGPADPETVAARLITEALLVDGHGVFVDVLSTGPESVQASYAQFGGPVFDLVQKLASDFINWTVLGRRIVISRGGLITGNGIARTAVLMCEDFINDTFTSTEDGLATLTQDVQFAPDPIVVNNVEIIDIGVGQVFLNTEVADAYYGLLQAVQKGNQAIAVRGTLAPLDALTLAAQNIVDGSYPPPVALSAANLQLSPNAPVTMAELVPGTIVPVFADCLCRPLSQEFILSKVQVTFDTGGESVEPTFISRGADNPGTFEEDN